MNDTASKRNRAGNFDQDDIDLFLTLVNENKALIDSSKQEDKKKGWDRVHSGFNASCTGIKRDVAALKMKLKNLKAHNKRLKMERFDDVQDSEPDTSANGDISLLQRPKVPRKRSKMFSNEETSLLQELVEKYFYCLDTSLTRDSLEQRNKAWETITEEFNRARVNDLHRDMSELKIKHKNMRAQRLSFKTEDAGNSAANEHSSYIDIEPISDESPPRALRPKAPEASTRKQEARPVRSHARSTRNELILDALESEDYSDDDDDYHPPPPPSRKFPLAASASVTSEEDRIRKENLVLKNAVLRKKERLLELQIALAERNLRRHQFQ